MKKEKISRKGFTLIELLLVVVVIVILAGTIMVSGEESIISAEANNIINNMRILKSAALEWIADYGDYIDYNGKDRYAITYPYPAILPADQRNIDGIGISNHIQNMLLPDTLHAQYRKTFTDFIEPSVFNKISFHTEDNQNDAYAPNEEDYAIVDNTLSTIKVDNQIQRSRWYVVYHPKASGIKLKQKLAEKAEEFGLLKSAKDDDYYTKDAKFVYMEILDFTKK